MYHGGMATRTLTETEARIKSIAHGILALLHEQLNEDEVSDALVNEHLYIQTAVMEFLASDSRRRMAEDEQIKIDRMRVAVAELDVLLDEVEEV